MNSLLMQLALAALGQFGGNGPMPMGGVPMGGVPMGGFPTGGLPLGGFPSGRGVPVMPCDAFHHLYLGEGAHGGHPC